MSVVTIEREFTFSAPKTTIFKLFAHENHSRVPKTTPHVKCEVIEGNEGTVKKANIGKPDNDLKHIKTKDEVTDKDNYTYSFTIVEGEPWSNSLEKVNVEIKVESSSNGGSILKNKSKYIPKPNCTLDEAKLNAITESIMDLYKHIDEQIQANPASCN
ncbi:Major strawberry allergen Fra a 1-A [Euphorbia peplus]|nr:Major strawberry allergen Fra a 1-A [Euphorbia peplus]